MQYFNDLPNIRIAPVSWYTCSDAFLELDSCIRAITVEDDVASVYRAGKGSCESLNCLVILSDWLRKTCKSTVKLQGRNKARINVLIGVCKLWVGVKEQI